MKYFTPFILIFPVWMVLATMTWFGKFTSYNLSPQRGLLFIAMGFTMVIIDLFLKYLIGKRKLAYVWVIETVILMVLGFMILPRLNAVFYVECSME